MTQHLPIVGVMGSGSSTHLDRAVPLGQLLARLGVHLLTGGGSGVMESVSKAFFEASRQGQVIGVLPCRDADPLCRSKPGYPNRYVEIPIRTHLPLSGLDGTDPLSRNHINVLTADAVVVLPGSLGTSSEARLAVQYQRPVIAYLGSREEVPDLDAAIEVVDELEVVEAFLRRVLRI